MKTVVLSIASYKNWLAILFLCLLAFSPAIFHLALHNFPVTNLATALGPVVAGFWFAAIVREIRVNSVLIGTLMTALLWSVNWLMFAGHTCCSTMD
jgi:hypothetical protein